MRYRLKPNFRALGPKLGKRVQRAKQILEQADAATLRVEMVTKGSVTIDLDGDAVELAADELEVAVEAKPGFAAAGSKVGVVVLYTDLTEDLIDKGLARELLSCVQGMRKDANLGYTDRIRLAIHGSERIVRVVRAFERTIATEALVVGPIEQRLQPSASPTTRELSLDSETVTIQIGRDG